jgi:hypothetical protein
MKGSIHALVSALVVAAALLACSLSGGTPPLLQSNTGSFCDDTTYPVVEGATWTFKGTGDGGQSTRVDTITDVGTNSFLIESKVTDSSGTTASVVTWTCTADGLVMSMSDGGQFSGVAQSSAASAQMSTLSVTGVTLPIAFGPGDNWTQISEYQLTSPTYTGPLTYIIEITVTGEESVSVPAGTFDALRLEMHGTLSFGDEEGSMDQGVESWYVPGIGTVREVSGASFGGGPAYTQTFELTSYSIP